VGKNQAYVYNPFKSPAILSIATGIRGLERGLERVLGNIRTVASLEIESAAIINLVAQMEQGLVDPHPIFTNAKTFQPKPFHKRIHGIVAGYPCQPFSLQGNRRGESDPRHLWPAVEHTMFTTGSLFGYFENVDDHLSLGFNTVYKRLRRLGYAVEAAVVSAEEVGAPHERSRLFILALEHSHVRIIRDIWKHNPEEFAFITRSSELKLGDANSLLSGGKFGSIPGTKEANDGKENQREWSGDESEYTGEAMADTTGPGLAIGGGPSTWREDQTTERSGSIEREDVADTDSRRSGTGSEQPGRKEGTNTTGSSTGSEVADANRSGSGQDPEPSELWPEGFIESPIHRWAGSTGEHYWPAGPGPQQFPWEEPRAIVGSLGFKVDGYNFREDFLRMLGNSVVEQAAAEAFIICLSKFLNV
jgi:site-specific DNA-cytosine methylase